MRRFFVTFRSVTYAQRGERLLRQAGLGVSLQRTPRQMEERGCGYSLGIQEQEVDQALRLLRQAQVPFRKVYLREGDGNLEEVRL